MHAHKLREIGEFLYGELWQSQLARALNINDRTVRRWLAGKSNIRPRIEEEIRLLLKEKLKHSKELSKY